MLIEEVFGCGYPNMFMMLILFKMLCTSSPRLFLQGWWWVASFLFCEMVKGAWRKIKIKMRVRKPSGMKHHPSRWVGRSSPEMPLLMQVGCNKHPRRQVGQQRGQHKKRQPACIVIPYSRIWQLFLEAVLGPISFGWKCSRLHQRLSGISWYSRFLHVSPWKTREMIKAY